MLSLFPFQVHFMSKWHKLETTVKGKHSPRADKVGIWQPIHWHIQAAKGSRITEQRLSRPTPSEFVFVLMKILRIKEAQGIKLKAKYDEHSVQMFIPDWDFDRDDGWREKRKKKKQLAAHNRSVSAHSVVYKQLRCVRKSFFIWKLAGFRFRQTHLIAGTHVSLHWIASIAVHSVGICFDAGRTSWSLYKWPWMRIYHRPNYTKGSKMSYDVTNHQQLYHYLCVVQPLSCTRRSVTSSPVRLLRTINKFTHRHTKMSSMWQRENKASTTDACCSQSTRQTYTLARTGYSVNNSN